MARDFRNVRTWRLGRLTRAAAEAVARVPLRAWPISTLAGVEEFGWRPERLENPGVATISNRSRQRKIMR